MQEYQPQQQMQMPLPQQFNIPQGMPMDIPISKDRDFMQWLFSFKEEVVAPLRHIWNGEEEVDPGRWEQRSKPVMNQEGITRCCSIIASYVNPVYVTSNYDENAMNWTMRKAGRGILNLLCKKFEDYGLEKINIPVVYMEIVSKIHAVLLGARGDGFRRFFSMTHHIEETKSTQMNQQNQSSGWGLFKKKQPQMYIPDGGY